MFAEWFALNIENRKNRTGNESRFVEAKPAIAVGFVDDFRGGGRL